MTRYSVDVDALRRLDREALHELDEHVARIVQREIEQKRRDEEEARRKKAKKRRKARNKKQ